MEPVEIANPIDVSKLFFEIYKNFNVVSQVERMKQLNERELYLLLTVCLDKFSDEDPVVKYNLLPFRDEIMAITKSLEAKDDEGNPLPTRRRGRPKIERTPDEVLIRMNDVRSSTHLVSHLGEPEKKKRGRPRKNPVNQAV